MNWSKVRDELGAASRLRDTMHETSARAFTLHMNDAQPPGDGAW